MCRKNISGVWVRLLTLLVAAQLHIPTSSGAPPVNEDGIAMPAGQGSSTAEAERVIVTGSHIPTAEEVGPNPVLAINRDQIEKAGERTAAELLRRLPIEGFEGIPTANSANFETAGASSVALRGFDASSTLVLLDGRRL